MLVIGFASEAQISDYKWGKLSKFETSYTSCTFEPEASAVVLNDEGKIEISSGHVVITRQRRIKILKKAGIEQANIEIPFYVNNDLESVKGVKGQTLNTDAKGKIVKIKVDSKKIFEEDLSQNWKVKKFTFPDVKVGSVLEYTYTTYSKNYRFLEGWVFQSEIPTLRSKLKAIIPEYLDYRILFEGRKILQKYGRSKPVNGWELINIHSIKNEPYTANYMDYAEKIRFQLAGYQAVDDTFNGTTKYVNTMTTWEKMAKELLLDPNYQGYLNRSGKAKSILEALQIDESPNLKNAQIIHDYVKRNFRWNDKNRIFSTISLSDFLKAKEGTNVEINLLLILLLRNVGFIADPVLLSTRSHGKIIKAYPFISQFNYMVCNVKIGEKEFLIDATDPYRPLKMLDQNHLNEEGFLLHKSDPRWVKIEPTTKSLISTYILGSIEKDGRLTCEMNLKYDGYFGLNIRKIADSLKVVKALQENWGEMPFSIESIDITHWDTFDKPVEIKLKLTSDRPVLTDDLTYFEPTFFDYIQENPFKSETRRFPVDFSYKRKINYVLNLKLSPEYKIEDSPENQMLAIPNKSGIFRHVSSFKGDQYQLSYSYSIDKPSIPSVHYASLREFYNLVNAKLDEVMVIKRK